jgi:hypothetical protein
MKNKKMFLAPSNPERIFQWGERYYYYNSNRESGNYDWHSDNLETAKDSPSPDLINAEWTFSTAPEKWNPELNFPAILPYAEFPSPKRNELVDSESVITLSWTTGRNAVTFDIYCSAENPPKYKGNQTETRFTLNKLNAATRYYWQIDCVTGTDTLRGEIWSFKTF